MYQAVGNVLNTHTKTTTAAKNILSILLGLQQFSKETQVEDLELFIQVHADDAVLSINAQQDTGGLPVLSKDDFDLQEPNQCGSGTKLQLSLLDLAA